MPATTDRLDGGFDPNFLWSFLTTPNASNSVNGSQIGPGDPVHFDSGTITKSRSGKVVVVACLSATLAAQNQATFTLSRDGTTTLLSSFDAPGGTGTFGVSCALAWIDTLPDNAAHFYRVTVSTSGATTETIPTGNVAIQLIEL